MSSQRRKAIYRRRRTVMVAALLGVLALILVVAIWRPWAGPTGDDAGGDPVETSAAPTTTPTPTEAYTPVSGAPEIDGAGGPCSADEVEITPITDQATYAAGVPVQLSFSIVNVSAEACSLNVGTTQQQFVVSTGAQTVYHSTDCLLDPVDQIALLEPGAAQQTVPITWDRTLSSTDTCTTERAQVVARGASYHLAVTVAGFPGVGSAQFILQ